MAYRSRQRVHGGGKFRSERQRRAIWANSPELGHLWAHNLDASGHRSQWAKVRRGAATHTGRTLSVGNIGVKSVGSQVRMGTRPRAGGNATQGPKPTVSPRTPRRRGSLTLKARKTGYGGRGSATRRGPRRFRNK